MFVRPLVTSRGRVAHCLSPCLSCDPCLSGNVALYEGFEGAPELSGPFEQSRDLVHLIVPWPSVPVLSLYVMVSSINETACSYEDRA